MKTRRSKQLISASLDENVAKTARAGQKTAPSEAPLTAADLNNPARLSAPQIMQLQRTMGNQAVQRLLGHTQPTQNPGDVTVQRKIFVGAPGSYSQVRSPGKGSPLKAIAEDDKTRRFKNLKEAETFVTSKPDNMGYLDSQNTWIRLDGFTVVGEDHSDPADHLIKALGTHRFRYEGFNKISSKRLGKDVLAQHMASHKQKKFAKHGLKQDAGEHGAEDIVPKIARALPDVKAITQKQKGAKVTGLNDNLDSRSVTYRAAGTNFGEGYSLDKTLNQTLLDALVYLASFNWSFSKNPLNVFRKAHSGQINTSIAKLREAAATNSVPNYEEVPITNIMDDLINVFIQAAKLELAGTPDIKAQLDLTDEPTVSYTKQSKELDYLRDASMYKTILEARSKDLLFIIGDAHRKKLAPLLAQQGIEAKTYEQLITEQKAKDAAAKSEAEA